MLFNIKPRPYQSSIFKTAISANTLVVLPTGLGKTAIAMLVAARRLILYPNKKILFLAPTKPLVEQQLIAFREKFLLSEDDFSLFTGTVPPAKRKNLWSSSRMIFSTPQTIENDVLSGSISLKDISLLVVDEAHRSVGDYAYVFLAKNFFEESSSPKILALTASPGSDTQKINEVCENLFIEKIEYRSSDSKDVKEFTNETFVKWDEIILPRVHQRIVKFLTTSYDSKLLAVKDFGLLKNSPSSYSKTQLLLLQKELHSQISTSDVSVEVLKSISLLAQALKLSHAIELASTQSLYALHEYLYGILSSSRISKTKAIKNLVIDPNFLSALSLTRDLLKENVEHPKLSVLSMKINKIIKQNPKAKIIIFSQFRDTAIQIQKRIKDFSSSSLFFGQAKKNGVGFSQKKQKEVLDDFKQNKFSVLIATSVAEEGLDIPSVDHVFFFEPVPSAIRSVQRRGRTGRHKEGFVTVLVTKGTKDEISRWVSSHKEKRMYSVLENLSKNFSSSTKTLSLDSFEKKASKTLINNSTLDSFSKKSSFKIIADYREKGSAVLKNLLSLNVDLNLKKLDVGDFLLSPDVCVEFKNSSDFLDSIVDGRLLSQLRSLVQYKKPLFVLEGGVDYSSLRKVDSNAILGMLSTIAISYKIPIIRTSNPLETAQLFSIIAKREQNPNDGDNFNFHSSKPLDDSSLQEFIVSSFPTIGPALAKSLLVHFDSLKNIVNADVEEFKKIPLIGDKKAKELFNVFNKSYKVVKDDPYKNPLN